MLEQTLITPVGRITVTEDQGALTGLRWGGRKDDHSAVLDEAAAQISAYFEGTLTEFELPLAKPPTASQIQWRAVCGAIPFGETRTYGDLAKDLGWPAQAVGQACGANPIAIIVPCHRVLAANGLGGFSGGVGIEIKVALLKHEGAASLLI